MKNLLVLLLAFFYTVASAEVFYPKEATISDAQGTFTSQSFDSPAINVSDNGSSVAINWGGNSATLYQNRESPNTYEVTQSFQGQTIKIFAYRSSQSGKLYLVTVSQKSTNESITIKFKPK